MELKPKNIKELILWKEISLHKAFPDFPGFKWSCLPTSIFCRIYNTDDCFSILFLLLCPGKLDMVISAKFLSSLSISILLPPSPWKLSSQWSQWPNCQNLQIFFSLHPAETHHLEQFLSIVELSKYFLVNELTSLRLWHGRQAWPFETLFP